ncbi:MAG TPA: hypothetical protein VHC72_16375, partial [Bryobacteraceae bacterium]|nr:hypothetical protein [Bryobacteraceae bacterium]
MIHAPFAYIGPGAGFAFFGSFLALLLSLLASLLSLLLWPFRVLLKMARRGRAFRGARVRKAVFVGIDGLDAERVEEMIAAGELPNLAGLKAQGGYRRLRPADAAWTAFATGRNGEGEPFWKILGGHDIGSTILRVPVPLDRFDG